MKEGLQKDFVKNKNSFIIISAEVAMADTYFFSVRDHIINRKILYYTQKRQRNIQTIP